MPVEEGLVDAEVLVGDDGFAGFQLDNPIHKQKRVTMGKVLADTLDIHRHLICHY